MRMVDFGVVKAELSGVGCMHTMRVLVRDRRYLVSGNSPEILIVTDKGIYCGGTPSTGGKFKRIGMQDVRSVRNTGRLFWKSIEVKYDDDGKTKSLYICPFTGEPHAPQIDGESYSKILELFNQYLK